MRNSRWLFDEDECPNNDHPADKGFKNGAQCGLCGKVFK